jgi:hypothetical protein
MFGRLYWPIWLTLCGVSFAIPELWALATNQTNTLSDYCWNELHVTRALEFTIHSVAWYSSFFAWLIFVIIITLHIWYRSV